MPMQITRCVTGCAICDDCVNEQTPAKFVASMQLVASSHLVGLTRILLSPPWRYRPLATDVETLRCIPSWDAAASVKLLGAV